MSNGEDFLFQKDEHIFMELILETFTKNDEWKEVSISFDISC